MHLNDTEIRHRNVGTSSDLVLGVRMEVETEQDYAWSQFEQNIKRDVPWLARQPENDHLAIVCGAAPSLKDHIADIADKQADGAAVYACNSAAGVLVRGGVNPDYQVILDPHQIMLYDFEFKAKCHLLASLVHPSLFDQSINPILWHPAQQNVMDATRDIDRHFTYIGGGVSVAMFSLCIAYAMGHRAIDAYGIDSSYSGAMYANGRGEDYYSHGGLLVVDIEHAGRTFKTTWDMKQQVQTFLKLAHALKQVGVPIRVHGDGLLPHAYKFPQQE